MDRDSDPVVHAWKEHVKLSADVIRARRALDDHNTKVVEELCRDGLFHLFNVNWQGVKYYADKS